MRGRWLTRGAIVLGLMLLAAGCGGDDEPDASSAACAEATSDLMTPLGNKMTVTDERVRTGRIVESEETPGLYFVSAEVYGEGVDEGLVGTWVTESRLGGEPIYAVDEVARDHSDWSDADGAIEHSPDDPAIEASRDCVTVS